VEVLGPNPAPLPMLRNRHRMQILLRCSGRGGMQGFLGRAVPALRSELGRRKAVQWDVDVDPVNLM